MHNIAFPTFDGSTIRSPAVAPPARLEFSLRFLWLAELGAVCGGAAACSRSSAPNSIPSPLPLVRILAASIQILILDIDD